MPNFIKDKKIFVFDTNVVLHDYRAIESFENTNILIPIKLLEEVDTFKKGTDTINYNAREFIRSLEKLASEHHDENILENGLPLKNGSKIFIDIKNFKNDKVVEMFGSDNVDNRILSVAYHLQEEGHRVVVISKDINVRVKSRALGIEPEDYNTDKINEISALFTGVESFTGESASEAIDELSSDGVIELDAHENVYPNMYFSYSEKEEDKPIIARYYKSTHSIRKIDISSINAYGIKPRNEEQAMALDALLDKDIPLVTVMGKAGTGKTLLALAAALERRKDYRQILLARPIVALSNRDIGFLPGDIKSKLDPYMQPLFDNLGVIQHIHPESGDENKSIRMMIENEKLVISPLAYIRGRSLNRVYFIIDEAQNLTPHEVKTIITRAGEGTKIVFTGDIHQIDTPYLDERSNGLTYLIDRMKKEDITATITLEKGERSKLAEIAANLL